MRGEIADALGRRHEQCAGAAGGVDDTQVGDGFGIAPVAHLFVDGEGGQQGGGSGGGVEGAVIAGGVEHGVEDAAQQVVAQAGDGANDGQGGAGAVAHRGGEGIVVGTGEKGGAAGLEDRSVIERQDQVPGVGEGEDRVGAVGALLGHRRRPVILEGLRRRRAVVKLGAQLVTVIVEAGVEHDRGDDDEQGAFGRGIEEAAFGALGAFGQVELAGKFPLLGFAETVDSAVETAGKGGGD